MGSFANNDPVVIDMSDPRRREVVALLQCRSMLKIEIKTGLRHSRGSVLKRLRDSYPGIAAQNKKQAVKSIEKYLREQHNFDVNKGRLV